MLYMMLKRRIHYQLTGQYHTNVTITGLEPNYPFLGLCSVYIHYHIFYRECV